MENIFNTIYEIRLDYRDVKLDKSTWDTIREYARGNKWFYVKHMGKLYRYVKAQEFFNRPTRFDFVEKEDDWDDTPIIVDIS